MTISYDALDTSIECRAIREGVPIGTAAMRTFALAAMAVAVDIPVSLRPALVAGVNRWPSEVGAGSDTAPYLGRIPSKSGV